MSFQPCPRSISRWIFFRLMGIKYRWLSWLRNSVTVATAVALCWSRLTRQCPWILISLYLIALPPCSFNAFKSCLMAFWRHQLWCTRPKTYKISPISKFKSIFKIKLWKPKIKNISEWIIFVIEVFCKSL